MPIEVVTCGDLAALGHPWGRLWQHDPGAMDPYHDVLCHCWNRLRTWSPEPNDPVACTVPLVVPITETLTLKICCLCTRYFADVLRSGEVQGNLHRWLLEQVAEAIAFRDRRRTDGSPVPCDMDVEAAGVMDRTEEE